MMLNYLQRQFSFRGALGRLGFFYAWLAIALFAVFVHLAFVVNIIPSGSDGTSYLLVKSCLGFLYLALLTPFIVRRLHDLGASGWFGVVFWVSGVFGVRNVMLMDALWGIKINIFSASAVVMDIMLGLLIIILFVIPGSSNKSLKNGTREELRAP